MISVEITGVDKAAAALEGLPDLVVQALRKKVMAQTINLQNYIQSQKLRGQVLHQRSGALSRSINQVVDVAGLVVNGRVFSSGDVKYAAIHEYGGVIHHPGGTPYIPSANGGLAMFVSKKFAAGMKGAELPLTKPHDITMPARSFMRSSLAENKSKIIAGLQEAAIDAARKALD